MTRPWRRKRDAPPLTPSTEVTKNDNLHGVWTVLYYNDRVRREIEEWPVGIYADFLRLVEWLEEDGLDLRMPHSRAMSGGLFELRCKGPEGIGRAFYCTQVGRELVILHSLVKKSQATPDKDLKLARRRLKEVKS